MHSIEIIPCELPEPKRSVDGYGTVAYVTPKPPGGVNYWPIVLVDGIPSDPDVATSYSPAVRRSSSPTSKTRRT